MNKNMNLLTDDDKVEEKILSVVVELAVRLGGSAVVCSRTRLSDS